jgi:hypothetical protein
MGQSNLYRFELGLQAQFPTVDDGMVLALFYALFSPSRELASPTAIWPVRFPKFKPGLITNSS